MENIKNTPVRETEVGRELQRLYNITENLGSLKDRYFARLEGVLSSDQEKDAEEAKEPTNSSKLGQELNTINIRLNTVAKGLDELLDRLEL